MGSLELLESSGELTNLQKSYIDKTESPINRLEVLFGFGTKHYQRTENASMSFEVVSVTDIAREVIYDMAAVARNKRIEIELDTESGTKGRTAGNAPCPLIGNGSHNKPFITEVYIKRTMPKKTV